MLTLRTASAQVSFDAATFTPPAGWQRSEQNGMVSYGTSGRQGRRPTYCQIFLFPSHPASNDPQQNFNADWGPLIAEPFATNAVPQMASHTTPEGWTILMGTINAVQRGIPITAILVSATGSGRAMNIVINVTGQDYVPEVRGFLESLRFGAGTPTATIPPPPAPNSSAPTGSLDDYVLTIPQGWTRTVYPDGIVYASPVFETGERCQLTTFQMRQASGDLLADARRAFADIFREDPFQNNSYPYATATISRGTAAAGWNYLAITKPIHGRVGDGTLLGVRVFAAQLGRSTAIITTTGKAPDVSMCFGELVKDEWPAVFFSLSFRNWTGAADAQLQRRMAGAWVTATASVADRYTFAANGRFASAAAAMTVTRISPTELLQTTNAYFGDGAYRLTGNHIELAMDRDRAHPFVGFVRLEQDSQDGVNWKDRLCLLLKGIGEVCYKRDE